MENAGRSQMAEGFFRKYAPKGWIPLSAGTNPSFEINPLVVEVMREVGVDISNQMPKILSVDLACSSSLNVGMGCNAQDRCPSGLLVNFQDWHIEDPKGRQIDKVRKIRDEIERKVKELVANLGPE